MCLLLFDWNEFQTEWFLWFNFAATTSHPCTLQLYMTWWRQSINLIAHSCDALVSSSVDVRRKQNSTWHRLAAFKSLLNMKQSWKINCFCRHQLRRTLHKSYYINRLRILNVFKNENKFDRKTIFSRVFSRCCHDCKRNQFIKLWCIFCQILTHVESWVKIHFLARWSINWVV